MALTMPPSIAPTAAENRASSTLATYASFFNAHAARCKLSLRLRAQDPVYAEPGVLAAISHRLVSGDQRPYAVSATPIRKTIHATNQEDRHPELRKLIPPPEAVVLPIIGRTPTPMVPRTVSMRAIFVQVDMSCAPFVS